MHVDKSQGKSSRITPRDMINAVMRITQSNVNLTMTKSHHMMLSYQRIKKLDQCEKTKNLSVDFHVYLVGFGEALKVIRITVLKDEIVLINQYLIMVRVKMF